MLTLLLLPVWLPIVAAGRMEPIDGLDLKQNYPNPFTNSTEIRYSVPSEGKVSLHVYNTLGQEVQVLVDEDKPVGSYTARFEASSFPSGQYTYTLVFTELGSGTTAKLSKRMYLVR